MDVRPSMPPPEGLEAYGVLGREALATVRTQTLEHTVRPFAEALLSEKSSAHTHGSRLEPGTHPA